MAANDASGVGVGVTRDLTIGQAVIIPMMVEEGVDGVSLKWEGTDNGDLKTATISRARWKIPQRIPIRTSVNWFNMNSLKLEKPLFLTIGLDGRLPQDWRHLGVDRGISNFGWGIR